MKQALEALLTADAVLHGHGKPIDPAITSAITALRIAIEQAEKQEPVALETVYETIVHWDEGGGKRSRRELARRIVDLYTTPQPQQEPTHETLLAGYKVACSFGVYESNAFKLAEKMYSAMSPTPQREWIGLTDEEIALVCAECSASAHNWNDISFAHAIEAKLKEKNT